VQSTGGQKLTQQYLQTELLRLQQNILELCVFCIHVHHKYTEFAILTAVVMKSSVFWNIMSCSPLFGGTLADFHKPTRSYITEDKTLHHKYNSISHEVKMLSERILLDYMLFQLIIITSP
jgi:hypothetical protein